MHPAAPAAAPVHLQREIDPGLTIACKELPAGAELPWHDHGRATLCVVYSGEVLEEDGRSLRRRVAGDLVFRAAPELHRNRVPGGGARILCLEIEGEALRRLERRGFDSPAAVYARVPGAAPLARLAEVELGAEARGAELRLLGIAYELLSSAVRAARRPAAPPDWLQDLEARLVRRGADVRTSLAETAREHGLSPRRLARAFRAHFATSVTSFARSARVERALQELASGQRPVAEVALACGFYDQSHLTRVFKAALGLTPGEFRKRAHASVTRTSAAGSR